MEKGTTLFETVPIGWGKLAGFSTALFLTLGSLSSEAQTLNNDNKANIVVVSSERKDFDTEKI